MNKIGACGDNCSFCLRHKATISKNANELLRVKELWVSLGWREQGINVEELKCLGCNKKNKCAYEQLRDCAFGKNIENCGMCSNYPCELNKNAFEKTDDAFSLLKNFGNDEEKDLLIKAFLLKQSNLDEIHNTYFSNS